MSASLRNRQWVLKQRPQGMVSEDCFELRTTDVPRLAEGQVLIRVSLVSVDPYMRMKMSNEPQYSKPWNEGDQVGGLGVGVVLDVNKNNNFAPGDKVAGEFLWQEYVVSNGTDIRKIDTAFPPEVSLGPLGMVGATAYLGLTEIGHPKPGETLVVSGAAGAVGGLVVQLGKLMGCRVVAVAGGSDKCSFVKNELGADATIDYKQYRDVDAMRTALQNACPDGIDVYFDNVGGETLAAVMQHLNRRARLVICGVISTYNYEASAAKAAEVVGRSWNRILLNNQASANGFIVNLNWTFDRWQEAWAHIKNCLASGSLKHYETVVEGFENIPHAFVGLFKGMNKGKLIVKISESR